MRGGIIVSISKQSDATDRDSAQGERPNYKGCSTSHISRKDSALHTDTTSAGSSEWGVGVELEPCSSLRMHVLKEGTCNLLMRDIAAKVKIKAHVRR